MSGSERYVVLGLAPPRSDWFRDVAQWAHAGMVPVEFVKCVSPDELRARLNSARPHSAVIIDGGLPGLDRDLVDAARRRSCAVIAVEPGTGDLMFDGVLPLRFAPAELTGVLAAHARPIGRADALPGLLDPEPAVGWRGSTAMVCGPGGTGSSTIAIALAQGLARTGRTTALADLSLRGEQAMLHGAPDVGPGIQELTEAHRSTTLSPTEVVAMTWHVEARDYHLLLGLRRRRSWSIVRPRAFERAFDGLRRAFDVVVADTDDDLEGEAEGGSVDVEERHVMARTVAGHADVVFLVGAPGMKGVHALLSVVSEFEAFGVPADRLVLIVNKAPRNPRARAEISRTFSDLAGAVTGVASPLFVPCRPIDQALRDGTRLPGALTDPLVSVYQAVIDRVGHRPSGVDRSVAVVPGAIGSWSA